MKVFYQLADFPHLPMPIVTSGTFDGVHRGHQAILERIKEIAYKENGQTVLITYEPHPRLVLSPNENLQLLNSLEEKIELLAQNGIEYLLVIPFTPAFSQLSSREFIQKILIETVQTKKLVIGFDHRFGKGREGSFEYLKAHEHEYPFEIQEIPRQDIENEKISSTRIRHALSEGRISEANKLLGRYYTLKGKVVKGDQLGRAIGFPTANLQISYPHKLVPKQGVYAAFVWVNSQRYEAMLYIGRRPVLQNSELRIEANLLNFNGNLYDQSLTIEIVAWVREDMSFQNLESLQHQIHLDKQQITALLQQEAVQK
ncbi:MAG: bifunctional riboflavin kinase/FAD synthetase [Microscillaceae bacterium]|nr:bifunctional riboflavin kinase/FAD synthetase [Microscillaceae bacterium]MDW8461471.1 bifunctional riboflavin kinase/FAD synthetase [Cytophagales bacterium]